MKRSCVVLLIIVFSISLKSQWKQSNGPWYGESSCFVEVDGNILAGTSGDGIFNSQDGGNSWSKFTAVGLTNLDIKCFLKNEDYLFAGTAEGVFLSTDKGSNWFAVNNGIGNSSVNCLLEKNSTIYAATNYGLLSTANNGASWEYSGYGITNQHINSIIQFDGNLYVGTEGGVFKSDKEGFNWSSSNFGLISQNINQLAVINGNIYAATNAVSGAANVYKSTNYGGTWSPLGLINISCNSLILKGTELYASTSDGIFKSADYGTNWSSRLNNLSRVFTALLVVDQNIMIGSNEGIFLYKESDRSINCVGYKLMYVWSMDIQGTEIWGTTFEHKLFYSNDEGKNWLTLNYPYLDLRYTITKIDGETVYMGWINRDLTRTGVFKSTDKGQSWDDFFNWNNRTIMAMEVDDDSTFFLGFYRKNGDYGLFQFNTIYYPWLIYNEGVWDIKVDGNNVFVATTNGVYKSTDKGFTWLNKGGSGQKLAITTNNIYLGGYGVSRSTDYGETWESIGLSEKYITSMAANDNIVIVGTDGGFFETTDNGQNWYQKNDGLLESPNNITLIEIRNGIIYSAVDDKSIMVRSIDNITEVEENQNIDALPQEYYLSQNFPNPFNPTTSIEYTVSSSEYVTLKVYDILGNEVETLVNEQKSAGSYSVKFNASDLSSGVYLYRLQTSDGVVLTKKLMLLK